MSIALSFVINILDATLLSFVDPSVLIAQAKVMNFLVVSYVTTGVIASVTSADIMSVTEENVDGRQVAHARVIVATLIPGLVFSVAIALIVPWIIDRSSMPDDLGANSTLVCRVFAFNAFVVAALQVGSSIFSIHALSRYTLYSTLFIASATGVLSLASFLVLLPRWPSLFTISIPLVALLTQAAAAAWLIKIAARQRRFSSSVGKILSNTSRQRIWRAYSAGISSAIEVASFVALTYVLMITIELLDKSTLFSRNYIAPWFYLITSFSSAWCVLANRQLADALKEMDTARIVMGVGFFITASALTAILSCVILSSMLLVLVISEFDLLTALVILLTLSFIEIFRSMNMVLLTVFRLTNNMHGPAIVAVLLQASFAAIMVLVPLLSRSNEANGVVLALVVLSIYALEEAVRTTQNFRFFRKWSCRPSSQGSRV